MILPISCAIGTRLAAFLTKPQRGYKRLDNLGINEVAKVLQGGDVVLIEGDTRISDGIKYLTQFSWSHACLYVGVEGGCEEKETLLEANLQDGVRIVALKHYQGFNLCICRPINLAEEDKEKLLRYAKARLGHKYDLKNIFDLARYIIQKPPIPNRYRRAMITLGSGQPTKVIC